MENPIRDVMAPYAGRRGRRPLRGHDYCIVCVNPVRGAIIVLCMSRNDGNPLRDVGCHLRDAGKIGRDVEAPSHTGTYDYCNGYTTG